MILLWKDKEQQILSLFQKGNNRAMDKLYMEYADYLTGVCARYISNEDQLKDVLQENSIPHIIFILSGAIAITASAPETVS